jgi:hypothetical protein
MDTEPKPAAGSWGSSAGSCPPNNWVVDWAFDDAAVGRAVGVACAAWQPVTVAAARRQTPAKAAFLGKPESECNMVNSSDNSD